VSNETGILHVVATPIGNLGDLSARAGDTLRMVGLIAAEDTRHTRRLLDHLGIETPMISLHDHNERERSQALVSRLQSGVSVALVSDAGTPLISDPGFRLVRLARAAGIEVRAVPGPCAAVAALSIAGLPTDRFVFEGFLAAKEAARRAQFGLLKRETRTMIFYVSPRRLIAELETAADVFGGDRAAVLTRELTKAFESSYDGTLRELLDRSHVDSFMQKGEMVLLIAGVAVTEDGVERDRLLGALLDKLPLKTAVDTAVRISGLSRNTLYKRALEIQEENRAKARQ
jgi:16S rRNA (cytidine1402-2'-O)-methyltransferase